MSNENIKLYYDQLNKNGPYATLAPHNRGGYKSQYVAAVFDEAIMPYFTYSTNENVLDFGCAAGILSNKLRPFTRLTVGVDISPNMLELAKKTAFPYSRQASYVQIDGNSIPFKDSQFDSVVARESLLHVSNEKFFHVLTEINRVLQKNGYFFLLEQTSESPYWRTQGDFSVRRSIDEIMERTRSAGFECIEARVVRKPRFPWIYLFWFGLLPKKLIHPLARLEVKFNRHAFGLKTKRWHDTLFVFQKVG